MTTEDELLDNIANFRHEISILEHEIYKKRIDLEILINELDCLRLDQELEEMNNDDR